MFDWNDEELANIVWGEAGDSDDHIVPYQKGSEDHVNKDLNQDSVTQTGQSTQGTKSKSHGRKLDIDSNFNTNKGMVASGFSMDSWPESSLSSATKTGQNCMGAEVSNNLNETAKFGSSGGKSERVKDPEVFEILQKSKEQGDFVDDGWVNIGSFDDFDRVFSNDDQIFGNVNIGNDDELWPSSKDVSDSPMKALPVSLHSPDLGLGTLRNTSEDLELGVKTEYMQDDKSCTLGCVNMDDLAYHGSLDSSATIDRVEYVGDRNNPILKQTESRRVAGKATLEKPNRTAQNVVTPNEFADKTSRPRKLLRSKNSEERSGGNVLQDFYGSWSSPVNSSSQLNQLASSVVQSHNPSVLSQQRQLQGPESLHYQNITDQSMPISAYGNLAHPYHTVPMMSHMQTTELKHQPLLYGYEASPANAFSPNNSADPSLKHPTMTPQEKIEKLRRRQQMQAMLAIKKQQQQFNNQTSADNCIIQKCSQDNQTQYVEGADLEVEDLGNLPFLDSSSTIDHEDSNAISVAGDGCSMEEIILNQLQDTVTKLDTRIRLCIRDSLLRLSQSAVQRLYGTDTNGTSKSSRDGHGTYREQDINSTDRYARMPDAETETNHIDRTVANLLFHRNLERPESPGPTKVPCDSKTESPKNLPLECLTENSKTKQTFPHQGFKDPCPLAVPQLVDQFTANLHSEVSENASITGSADEEAMEVEASQ